MEPQWTPQGEEHFWVTVAVMAVMAVLGLWSLYELVKPKKHTHDR